MIIHTVRARDYPKSISLGWSREDGIGDGGRKKGIASSFLGTWSFFVRKFDLKKLRFDRIKNMVS